MVSVKWRIMTTHPTTLRTGWLEDHLGLIEFDGEEEARCFASGFAHRDRLIFTIHSQPFPQLFEGLAARRAAWYEGERRGGEERTTHGIQARCWPVTGSSPDALHFPLPHPYSA